MGALSDGVIGCTEKPLGLTANKLIWPFFWLVSSSRSFFHFTICTTEAPFEKLTTVLAKHNDH